MRTLVTGARGMLGQDLVTSLREAGHEVTAAGRPQVDITDLRSCERAVDGHDLVVNAAAWTAVDDAEASEQSAYAVNATGAANLARACAAAGARMVHISTDYVFDGAATSPYAEDAATAPRSAYGRTKLAGEQAVRELCPDSQIVRTAWLYGAGGPNFLATMARLAQSHETLSVVDDQRGQPTWTGDLATQLVSLIGAEAAPGIYHGTASGETTWFGLTRALFEELGLDPERVQPTTSEAFPRPAPRPAYSVLGHWAWSTAGVAVQRDWRTALREAVPQLGLTAST
ncbi:dTDP-4-dehydrorhamnose reductase [Demetria terragena]|uniref:dTDP-4-dehydrorhamnose reductase n=1 Tax=Demetria terragena TaxID=63959 RepID=UPI00037FE941|nr:dTDP-4-dehydrorhamnose reductase [Demetria terragena]